MTDLQVLEKRVSSIPIAAELIKVNDDRSLEKATSFVVGVKTLRKEIAGTFDPIIDKTNKAHKEAVAQKRKYDEPLRQAEVMVKGRISDFYDEIERRKREAEAKAREEEARIKKLQQEQLEEAEAAIKNGDTTTAKELIEKEIPMAGIFIPEEKPKMVNGHVRKIPTWEAVDEDQIPREYWILDSVKITKLVKSTKGEVRIPGIRVYFKSSIAI